MVAAGLVTGRSQHIRRRRVCMTVDPTRSPPQSVRDKHQVTISNCEVQFADMAVWLGNLRRSFGLCNAAVIEDLEIIRRALELCTSDV